MSNKITKLITAIVGAGVQPIEDALTQLLTQRTLDTAVGAQLDAIGVIVGQARGGLDDDTYRLYLRARIAVHRSNGTFNDLIKVATLLVDDDAAMIVIHNEGTATVRLFVSNVVLTDDIAAVIANFEQSAVSAGVRIVVEWIDSPAAGIFRLDVGPGLDVGHLANSLG